MSDTEAEVEAPAAVEEEVAKMSVLDALREVHT